MVGLGLCIANFDATLQLVHGDRLIIDPTFGSERLGTTGEFGPLSA